MVIHTYTMLGTVLTVYILSRILKSLLVSFRLRSIPSARSSSLFGSYVEAVKFVLQGRDILQWGYDKYPNSAFKVPEINKWHVIVSGDDMIEDMKRAGDDVLSLGKAVDRLFHTQYNFGEHFHESMYHAKVVRGPLTRNIATKFVEVSEEVEAAFEDEIAPSTEWTNITVTAAARRIIARTGGRLFFGLPLCRDPVLQDLSIDFAIDLAVFAVVLDLVPGLFRPLVAPLFRSVPRHFKRCRDLFGASIQDRLDKDAKYGPEWDGRPNDLISWLLDHAPPDRKNVDDVSRRILMLLFGSVHTTSIAFTWTIYYLAAYTQYIQPLREEIESVMEQHGWSKVSMGKLNKLDSFLKETQRVAGLAGTGMGRLVVKDFKFSNGTEIPEGTFISLAAYSIHHDETIYDDPYTFKPFRFSDIKETSEGDGYKNHMVTPSSSFLFFGHGRHMCPGRFFAVNEIKTMVAHVLLHYDIKLEGDKKEPPKPKWFGQAVLPDDTVKVQFRARRL